MCVSVLFILGVFLPPCSEGDENAKKHMERLLNIWKERSLYRADFIQQLKLAIDDSNSPRPSGSSVSLLHVYE